MVIFTQIVEILLSIAHTASVLLFNQIPTSNFWQILNI